MGLLTQELRKKLPPLYTYDGVAKSEVPVLVKFFTPDSNFTFYVTEYDGDDLLYGLVSGTDLELGYFSLSELESARGPLGLRVQRDRWTTRTLAECYRYEQTGKWQ